MSHSSCIRWDPTRRSLALAAKMNAVINTNPGRLTIKEIYSLLVTQRDFRAGYGAFFHHVSRARKLGLVDGGLIREGRGQGGGLKPKYQVGDKVRIRRGNGRTPGWLRAQIRLDTSRTVVRVCRRGVRIFYRLGTNRQGTEVLESHAFRAYELAPYVKSLSVGRPRSKRSYRRHGPAVSPCIPVRTIEGLEPHPSVSPSISCANYEDLSVTP
jgi:hypothetical protein